MMSLPHSRFARPVLFAATLLLAACLTGCKAQHTSVGRDGEVLATYKGTTLSANLPAEARVPAVMAAAEQVLRGRGYAIDQRRATEETGKLIARPPRSSDFPRLVIEASAQGDRTFIELSFEPFGDQNLCRGVLDGILQRLGM